MATEPSDFPEPEQEPPDPEDPDEPSPPDPPIVSAQHVIETAELSPEDVNVLRARCEDGNPYIRCHAGYEA